MTRKETVQLSSSLCAPPCCQRRTATKRERSRLKPLRAVAPRAVRPTEYHNTRERTAECKVGPLLCILQTSSCCPTRNLHRRVIRVRTIGMYCRHALCALSDEAGERARDGGLEEARIRARGEEHPRRVRVTWRGEGRARAVSDSRPRRSAPGWRAPPSTA